jgi:hypothetical protein
MYFFQGVKVIRRRSSYVPLPSTAYALHVIFSLQRRMIFMWSFFYDLALLVFSFLFVGISAVTICDHCKLQLERVVRKFLTTPTNCNFHWSQIPILVTIDEVWVYIYILTFHQYTTYLGNHSYSSSIHHPFSSFSLEFLSHTNTWTNTNKWLKLTLLISSH